MILYASCLMDEYRRHSKLNAALLRVTFVGGVMSEAVSRRGHRSQAVLQRRGCYPPDRFSTALIGATNIASKHLIIHDLAKVAHIFALLLPRRPHKRTLSLFSTLMLWDTSFVPRCPPNI